MEFEQNVVSATGSTLMSFASHKHPRTAEAREIVSVIMPVRNEAPHIIRCLEVVLGQTFPADSMEVIIADGLSDDGTREKLEEFARRDRRVRVIVNRGRIVSTGLNAAIKVARGNIIIRMDAHTEYAEDYVRQCAKALRESGAQNVGGAWRATGRTYLQKAIALAFQSPFSSGGAGSREVDYEGEVDSVYLGCWRKSTLERLGGFDEELVRNQDDELNLRLIRMGGRVWQSSLIKSSYYPRASLIALFRQYAQYGYWKVRVIQKHRLPASVRHLVPGTFLFIVGLVGILSLFSHLARLSLVGIVGLYGIATMAASFIACNRIATLAYIPVMPTVFMAYHLGYGYGFLRGMVDFILLRRSGSDSFTYLTRTQKI
jgi:succinoglycan biosynthesis protein ExoA